VSLEALAPKTRKVADRATMNKIRDVERLNMAELESGVTLQGSWHMAYRASNYVFVGGLPFDLTEGDLEVVMSQFGVITDLRLQRDPDTGKSKGFGWLSYADWRSTVLAVDNMNGVELLGRKLGVDHAANYTPPPAEDGPTWWQQKQHAVRKKEKKEKRKHREKKEKKKSKRAAEGAPPPAGGK
jgi:RNA-binding motif X-linked protein 2